MNLVVDYGNTRTKLGVFKDTELINTHSFTEEQQLINFLKPHQFDCTIVSSVSRSIDEILPYINSKQKLVLDHTLPLPIQVRYGTPKTLGVDRIAAACGTLEIMPHRDCLVVDMGTCINYEFIDSEQNYQGGAISPGIKMRFEAMHTFTSRLPLVSLKKDIPLTGTTTEECMQSGVMNGVRSEIEGIINRYKKKYPNLGVILCGGDSSLFENNLKQPIFVAPNLVLRGLNRILLHNASF